MKTIEIDDSVYDDLGKLAIPFIDKSPNMVIMRLIEHYRKFRMSVPTDITVKRRPPGKRGYGKLSSAHYREPIIAALKELGGCGSIDDVYDIVFKMIADKLSDIDFTKTASGFVRWKSTVQWERYCIIKDGIIKANSGRGVGIESRIHRICQREK
jgi:hypothetical protein